MAAAGGRRTTERLVSDERYKSAEQVLEQHIRDMGDELGRVYNALSIEVSWLHIKWQLYRQLFAKSEARIELLNEAAGHCFGVLQRALADGVLLHIARVTDREQIAGRSNLTICALASRVPNVALRTDVVQLVATALATCDPLRAWRHRQLAHGDLAAALGTEVVAGVSRAQIEEALRAIRAVLNRIERHYGWSPMRYDDPIVPGDDGDMLVYYLSKGLRQEKLRHQRFREGKPLPEDLRPEDDFP